MRERKRRKNTRGFILSGINWDNDLSSFINGVLCSFLELISRYSYDL